MDDAFGRRSELEIDGIDEQDFTEYNCTVINRYGSHSALISLERSGEIWNTNSDISFILIFKNRFYFKVNHGYGLFHKKPSSD